MFIEKKLAIFIIVVVMVLGVTTVSASNLVNSVLAMTMKPGNETGGNMTASGITDNLTSGNMTSSNTSSSMAR